MVIRRMKPLGFTLDQMRDLLDDTDRLDNELELDPGKREILLGRLRECEQAATEQVDKLRIQLARRRLRRNAPYAPARGFTCRVLTCGDPAPRPLSGLAPAGGGRDPHVRGRHLYTDARRVAQAVRVHHARGVPPARADHNLTPM